MNLIQIFLKEILRRRFVPSLNMDIVNLGKHAVSNTWMSCAAILPVKRISVLKGIPRFVNSSESLTGVNLERIALIHILQDAIKMKSFIV